MDDAVTSMNIADLVEKYRNTAAKILTLDEERSTKLRRKTASELLIRFLTSYTRSENLELARSVFNDKWNYLSEQLPSLGLERDAIERILVIMKDFKE